MKTALRRKPNVVQYIRYCYGRPLPDSMRDWVLGDLADERARRRDAHIHQSYVERYGPRPKD